MDVKVVIAGDTVLSHMDNSLESFIMDINLKKIVQDSDYSLVNFEAPIKTKLSKPILKTGPVLSQPANSVDVLINEGFKCFTLANNHLRDYGQSAIENTIDILQAKGVDYLGAGQNLKDAGDILYKNIRGIKVAFINVCEKEWSIATENRAGSNPLHPLRQYYQIKEAKAKADYVIMIYHGGVEHYQLPFPELKLLHRFFIDSGADAVITHHQHCFSGYEVYNGKPIFYGIGNFVFNRNGILNSPWNYGYMVELILKKEENTITFNLHPYEQCNNRKGAFYLVDKGKFISEINVLNKIISDDNQLAQSWNDFVSKHRTFYTPTVIPYKSRVLNKLHRMGLLPSFMSKHQLYYIYDVTNCYSHRLRFIDFLENKINNK